MDRFSLSWEFRNKVALIQEGKANFSEDEQGIIDSWLQKLTEQQEKEETVIRNKYARALAKQVTQEKQLSAPFNEPPPVGDLTSLPGDLKSSFNVKPIPCKPKSSQGIRPAIKTKRTVRSLSANPHNSNYFEDPEEMAKVIARSKGQSLADFVGSISRHTADFGQELRRAMKLETMSFKEYVDDVLTQRIKDLTEVLNEEQTRELKRIKEDIVKWQAELALVKRRIEEMIPEFDLDAYKNDKNYLKKLFTIKPAAPEDDSFKKWKEESTHRLKWISDRICKTARCNEQTSKEISNIKCETASMETNEAMKQQSYISQINCEITEYQNLQAERDKLHKENNELLCQLKK